MAKGDMYDILSKLANKRITPDKAKEQLEGIGLSDEDITYWLSEAQKPANLANYPLEPTDTETVRAQQEEAYASILPISRERTKGGRSLAALAAQRARFGGGAFSDFAQQAMDRAFNPQDLMSRFLLEKLGTQQAGGEVRYQAPKGSFEAFARRAPLRGNAEIQSIQLRNILAELESFADPNRPKGDARMEFRQALQGAYANPDAAFNAALQPVLSRIAPALEAAFLAQAERDYRGAISEAPLQFTSPVGSFRHFNPYFRERGAPVPYTGALGLGAGTGAAGYPETSSDPAAMNRAFGGRGRYT